MPNRLFEATFRRLGGALIPLLVAGCMTPPEEAPAIAQPKSMPVRNLTSFSEPLRCMDRLLADFGRRNIVITSAGIPDETASISTGTKDMLISAVSRMSVDSGAFTFVDFDQTQTDVHSLQGLVGFTDAFVVPNYYIRGAITQLDEGVLAESYSAAVGISDVSISGAADEVVSVVSLDLNIGDLVSRQIIPGISAHNSIAVARTGKGGTLSANIEKLGVAFNVSLNRSEGMHQAVRTLIELSVIEALGKLAQVPYWRCLYIEQTNPAVVAEAREWFDDMSAKEQVVFTQRALTGLGYYDGPITGERDQSTKGAIARYQADNDLIADGRVSFQLYTSLIAEDLALGRQPDPLQGQVEEVAARPNPLRLTLATPNGDQPTYAVEETLEMTVIASRDAYLYCYYSDGRGTVARVFPNRFQPDPYVAAGRAVQIPSESAGFDIVFDRPGVTEEVACVASQRELGLRLPQELKTESLAPMPVETLDEVVETFEQIDGLTLAEARLPIRVTN